MPIYEYECEACGHRSEELQKMGDPPLATCPACGGPYKKLLSAPSFQFKGSGWYVTDYARKDRDKGGEAKGEKEGGGEGAGKEGGGEAAAKEGGGETAAAKKGGAKKEGAAGGEKAKKGGKGETSS
jgi:putative FmdB family regulatory protein